MRSYRPLSGDRDSHRSKEIGFASIATLAPLSPPAVRRRLRTGAHTYVHEDSRTRTGCPTEGVACRYAGRHER